MTLKKYKEKRQFDNTPEPEGGAGSDDKLRFVVQKHDASRLHYDFRLELNGVMKSWAVPKGPSLDPAVKRLAMMVEDHPYDYKDFEGVIPAGNYGAGTVIVWDEGTYEAIDGSEKKGTKPMEKSLLKSLKKGDLKFKLNGKKLKGEFVLVKTNSDKMGENAWLLIKHKDKHISDKDITKRGKSVLSGKTIEKMEKNPEGVYGKVQEDGKKKGKKQPTKVEAKVASNARKATTKPKAKKAVKKTAAGKTTKAAPKRATVKKKTEQKAGTPKSTDTKRVSTSEQKATLERKREKVPDKKDPSINLKKRLKTLPLTPMPKRLKPMLATLVDAPFTNADWEFEVKWDGYRAIAYVDQKESVTARKGKAQVKMQSRNQKPFEQTYYPIRDELEARKEKMVLDGEIVVIDPKTGISKFNALQNWRSEADGQLMYYVFDVLWYEGKDITSWPLSLRRGLLRDIFDQNGPGNNIDEQPADSIVRLGFSIEREGESFFKSTEKLGLEGMVAKKLDSSYDPGARTKDWLKIKVQKRQEVIIIGFTRNAGTSKLFSSLLLGVYDSKELKYVGKVGTGFTDKEQKELMKTFKPLQRKTSPLAKVPDYNKASRFRPHPPHADATWLKPVLVGEVSYAERTQDGVFRHPSFKGLRTDKAASEVTLEVAIDIENIAQTTTSKIKSKQKSGKNTGDKISPDQQGNQSSNSTANVLTKQMKKQGSSSNKRIISHSKSTNQKQNVKRATKRKGKEGIAASKLNLTNKGPARNLKKTLLNPHEKTQVKKVQGRELKFTNLNKLYWPEEHISKRELINYYYQVAPFIMPYLTGRPQSLNRFPNGIQGKSFYQKDVTGKVADWLATFPYHSEGDKTDKHFLVADNSASLLYMASLGCIEMNPWSSTVKKPDHPTWCIIDLDPDKKSKGQKSFEKVIEAARITRDVLDSFGILGYPKTSGASGMHIYIPLGGKYTYEQSKEFARIIVTMVHHELPSFTTLERAVSDRKGKMYLDFLQNRPQATIAAPYSVRPTPGGMVSMPLDWSEVKSGLKREDYHLRNAIDRLISTGDLFKPVLGKGIDLKKVLRQLKEMTITDE